MNFRRSCAALLILLAVPMLCGFASAPQTDDLREENCIVSEDGSLSVAWNQRVSKNYCRKRRTGGPLEAAYLAKGPYATVSRKQLTALQDFKQYVLYYPAEMENGNETFPVVIFSNGTGVPASQYRAVLERMTSWGFIVMATEEQNSWNGFSSEMCLRKLLWLNEAETVEGWSSNPFYHTVDLDNIGVVGHSQGGVGVFNAATENKNGYRIRTIVAESPTNLALAEALDWHYDPSAVRVPTLLLSGTGNTDENLVVSKAQLAEIYNTIPADAPKFMLRRTGADHSDMLSAADGYVTAWLCWQLKDDQTAARAFVGSDAEAKTNVLYQDAASNF